MGDWDIPVAAGESALADSTNGTHEKPLGGPRDAEKAKLAREKGWAEPQDYDYKATIAPLNPQGGDSEAVNDVVVPGWMARAAKYEWQEGFGEVGPPVPSLEEELFGGELRVRKGTQFDLLTSIKVVAEATERPDPIRSFDDAGLHPTMLENVKKCGYNIPTPIQAYTIPAVLKGRDVIGIAQTGSGKTAAFFIPVLSKLMGKAKKLCGPKPSLTDPDRARPVRAEPLVLVVAPTRELCIQIFDEARRLTYRSMLRACVVYGGAPIREQRDDLRKGCDVLVATPGRLKDFMKDPSLLSMSRLRYTIIDEADEMLHEDWQEDFAEILNGGGSVQDAQHQYLLFSATFDKRIRTVAKKYLSHDFVRIRIGRTGSTMPNIKQQIVWVDGNMKNEALYDLLIASPPARTLIFVRSRRQVDVVDDFLYNRGMPTTSIHAERTQLEREDAIRSFRRGKCPILIATGVSARGLDIRNVLHVINFDLPSVDFSGQDEYIHRIGRTGRLGNQGLATSFYNEKDEALASFLAKILVENGQAVPDFLDEYKPPENEELNFDDDSGDEENEPIAVAGGAGGNGDAWGADPVVAAPVEDAWGTGDASQTNGGADAWGTGNAAATNGDSW